MTSLTPQPSSPAEWEEYAKTDLITRIPLKQDQKTEGTTSILRDVFLNDHTITDLPASSFYLYCDILAFTKSTVTITPDDFGLVQIIARVLTADKPTNLNFVAPVRGCQVYIYASILDQPVTVSVDNSSSISLDLGAGSQATGVLLRIQPGRVLDPEYQTTYVPVEDLDLQESLETQMRIALAFFWQNPSIAISLCAFVAAVTHSPPLYPELNAQAAALGRQLSAHVMTGPDTSYAPVLKMDSYRPAVDDTLAAVKGMEEQYELFLQEKDNVHQQIDIWKAMLQQAESQRAKLTYLAAAAWDKYEGAASVVATCQNQMVADNEAIENSKHNFLEGIEKWRDDQKLKAVFLICEAIVGFGLGIGLLSLGNPEWFGSAVKSIEGAIDKALEAEDPSLDHENVMISSRTLEMLNGSMNALETVYPTVDVQAQAVHKLSEQSGVEIPTYPTISGSSQGDADAHAIVALGAWDAWRTETDAQLAFAVEENVDGAPKYRLDLEKHGINGKSLAQAEAEAIKAGNEYVQAQMDVIICDKDIANLNQWLQDYEGDKEIYEQACAKFFDRCWALRTSLVIAMRNIVWAYKYWALSDSSVVLDSQKAIEDFAVDLATLDNDIISANESYTGNADFQPFNFTVYPDQLPSDYSPVIVAGLQSSTHTACFTLAPSNDPTTSPNFSSVFIDGGHFRLNGLETFLVGAAPRPEALQHGVVQVDIQISTSGAYADVKEEIVDGVQVARVFDFVSQPRSVRFSYDLREDGTDGKTRIHAIFPTEYHAEPTPFTQWTIQLLHPERLDLSGLTGVQLEWDGKAHFPPPLSAPAGLRRR
ncbi:uncharacterized protein BDW70DRAFT_145900 [Aspergillus foveolatus]|uniref:uncharacterized protein n=1 Tax=Aspergillus foveolatus TaxID=210207 RepID=UPI003CCD1F8E